MPADMLRKVIVCIPQDELYELLGIQSSTEYEREIMIDGDYLKIKIRSPLLPEFFESHEREFITHVSLQRFRESRGAKFPAQPTPDPKGRT